MKANTKQLSEKIAALEAELGRVQDKVRAEAEARANAPMMAAMPMAENCAKEVMPRQVPKSERRAKLIAAHVALDAIRHDLGDYAEYQAINQTQASISAAIGRLELRD